MLDVVICICTCRRPDGLLNLLRHIAEIEYDGSCAIVVIDNDSNTQGLEVCNALTDYRWPLTSALEKRQGIAYARNAAVTVALKQKPRFIAMLDDDEWPSKQWLAELMRIQKMHNSDAVSGPVLPVFPDNAQPWSDMPEYYGSDQRLPDGTPTILYASGNFLVRASCFKEMLPTPFDLVISKTGADDMVFFRHLDQRGYKMHWASNAVVDETVTENRLSLDWLKRRHIRTGNTNVVVQRMFEPGLIAECIRLTKTGGLLVLSSAYWLTMSWHHKHRIRSTLLVYKAIGKVIGHTGFLKDYLDHGG